MGRVFNIYLKENVGERFAMEKNKSVIVQNLLTEFYSIKLHGTAHLAEKLYAEEQAFQERKRKLEEQRSELQFQAELMAERDKSIETEESQKAECKVLNEKLQACSEIDRDLVNATYLRLREVPGRGDRLKNQIELFEIAMKDPEVKAELLKEWEEHKAQGKYAKKTKSEQNAI